MSYAEFDLGLHCLYTYKVMMRFFSPYLSKKMGSDISCNMSPDENLNLSPDMLGVNNLGLLKVCTVCICTN